ncbi:MULTISPECIES: carbohydrate ABC transporter permease [Hungatella]|uniref:Binding-protein-dependent transport system inner membrane protein n=1 Tax=Hungatella hathewayi TaxID=154046 RepID=A0A174IZE0_9FIRM|nr:carbohydrate ABC transporter permease [Hungatella hathewayi]CUO92784.1 binding-protein-dependent transport system inner membrane protein [Hungatella hathewayi]
MTFRGKKKRFIDVAVYIGLTVFAVFYSLPFISMIGTALKGDSEALSNSALFPKHLVWDSFRKVLEGRFIMTTVNSMKISLCVSLLCVILACLSGYALSRCKGKIFALYGSGVMVLQMFPMMLMLIPLFLIYKNLHLIDTHLSLILSYTCLNLPFSVWLMKGFFDTVPYELEESAYIDGCGKFDTLMRIVIPVSLPGIATAGIFTFLNVWNEYTFSNTFVKNPDLVTLTVGLQDYLSQNSNSWGQMMAASTIGIIPSVLFLLFAQKYLIQGMTAGAVKG